MHLFDFSPFQLALNVKVIEHDSPQELCLVLSLILRLVLSREKRENFSATNALFFILSSYAAATFSSSGKPDRGDSFLRSMQSRCSLLSVQTPFGQSCDSYSTLDIRSQFQEISDVL
ncbi:hypothetical protein BLNAU_23560 [Blattamonas nauphoetae]|uniref:Uncharacterized protein n=1 Tax=Blattamonas nauphoetae TaxID=2049346 RepID=A0ABQ9WPX0_9EUKA|nr:hypothetical protein BLNAU_23560 [Blattamonas nauphoetae]